jgi:hypothetical protein
MKELKKMLVLFGCVAALGLGAGKLSAQGNGNFDPAAARQRMMDRYRETLEVKDDGEWKVLETAIGKVMDARREIGGGFGGGGGRRNRPNANATSADPNAPGGQAGQGGQGGRRRGGGTPSPEAVDLQKSIDDKASAEELKPKLAKLREATKTREAKLESAQEDLRKLLTTRQEANAVLMGLLK